MIRLTVMSPPGCIREGAAHTARPEGQTKGTEGNIADRKFRGNAVGRVSNALTD